MSKRLCLSLIAAASAALLAAGPASATGFANGDIFASIGGGQVQVYSPTGTPLMLLNTGVGGYTTGSTTDKAGNFYVTNFSAGSVTEFDKNGALVGTFASGYTNPESILFNKAQTAFVGDAGQNHIHQVGGADITVQIQDRGTDWIDLASNQTTFYYTSEGTTVFRYDLVGGQLSPFATGLPGSTAYELRILPDGNVLVADTNFDVQLNTSGQVIDTYNFSDSGMFSLNLTPDGKDFWTGSFSTGNLYEVDLATGSVIQTIHTGSGSLYGVSVYGEQTQGGGGHSGVPEPGTWALLLMGAGLVGGAMRSRRALATA
ncbi:MAG TPA: PEPxxWA-CTERM sorting domain-containing protein [Caulobacteraceae bacterium]|nr:PEPxxWA-CTERM sorting domain-containing protein [Caulobacteraceae bacterium]